MDALEWEPFAESTLRLALPENLLRKPKLTSTSLSSIMRMRKEVVSDPDSTRPRGQAELKIWEFPGWFNAIGNVLADDEALVRRGGTPYAAVLRVMTSTPHPLPVALANLDLGG